MSGFSQRACRLRVRGVVQGVGFRPFVFRLAQAHGLKGWVLNGDAGVEIQVEGDPDTLDAFSRALRSSRPMAATITDIDIESVPLGNFRDFSIRDSEPGEQPTVRISPDLPLCDECLEELEGESRRRRGHAYISCSQCGPRYSIIRSLPYDRSRTTMAAWPMCGECEREYHDPSDRRFHAQTIACNGCGPAYVLMRDGVIDARGDAAVAAAARMIANSRIVGVKGLGGYCLACDASNVAAVATLRTRKYRKEKPFAIMARDLETVGALIELSPEIRALLLSPARPIVLSRARLELPAVAPDTRELGVMLPHAPIHHLLFGYGAPPAIVMTSGNRSSEPIAHDDDDALARLAGIADVILVGQRQIARRVDDSVVRCGAFGPQILRRSRGYAPGVAARIPLAGPTLALGADLKNTIALVVDGGAVVSQHIGDLEQMSAMEVFEETVREFLQMYQVDVDQLVIAHDMHPQYVSTQHAAALPACARHGVQHHRAHLASIVAERGAFDRRVLGIAFDGAGYGDDGAIWGGEFFVGSVVSGFERVGHLRPAVLPGGDAAARHPVQAAAGFLAQLDVLPDMMAAPFCFPARYRHARRLVAAGVRTFPTTSVGRLFDTVAALLGFAGENTYEGRAAMWLEQLAGRGAAEVRVRFVFRDGELDFRPALEDVISSLLVGHEVRKIARGFHFGMAAGIVDAAHVLCESHDVHTIVLGGGVFQNDLLLHDIKHLLNGRSLEVWTNQIVPPNDGGLSLGQAALMLGAASRP
jgi:hydrogenase maturation protein HypF